MKRLYETVVCVDGFSMSVQASETNYCTPRNNKGPYSEVEVGFPSEREDLLIEYAESPEDPTGTVYGWVPALNVWNTILKHGGIASGELPLLTI